MSANEFAKDFSPLSTIDEYARRKRRLVSSQTVGWTSLLVQNLEGAANTEIYETTATPDVHITLITKGEFEIENFSGRSVKSTIHRAGFGGVTAGGKIDRLRLQSKICDINRAVHIYIPPYFFVRAAEEFRRAGTASPLAPPDIFSFVDPVVSQMAFALVEAVKSGAPNFYAESAAQFLATHLLSKHGKWSEAISAGRNPGVITDRRIRRVLEFMEHHFAENPSLEQLAAEAAISPFHFVRLFKKSCGLTPHQYLLRLKMNAAAELLENTDLSVKEIAFKCGFVSVTHFSVTFRKYFSQVPSEYRLKLRSTRSF